ncbi:MAG: HAD-IA family hydrolase [Rhodospirillales bacterium]|nr:HAD-IA family hydrolase [Rhodospirillales bacterium]
MNTDNTQSDENPRCLAVFDVDGTLIDSQHSIVGAMADAWRAHGKTPLDRETVLRIVGLPLLEAIAQLSPEEPPERHQKLRDSYVESWTRQREDGTLQEPLYPGALEVLEDLENAGWLLGISTGKSRRGLNSVLKIHPFDGRFVTIQTSDVSRGKPHPDMLLSAMKETGADATATAMIGDTTFDIQMARNAGTYAVGVDWGYHPTEELWAAGAHAVISDFRDLPKTLATLVGAIQD